MRALVHAVVFLCAVALTLGAVALLDERLQSARDARRLAERAERSATNAAISAAWAFDLTASCEASTRADLDAAHARIRALETSLRAVAAGNPCRVRLPRPIDDAPRPFWCEDRTSWWAEPLPTLGARCYSTEARDPGWLED